MSDEGDDIDDENPRSHKDHNKEEKWKRLDKTKGTVEFQRREDQLDDSFDKLIRRFALMSQDQIEKLICNFLDCDFQKMDERREYNEDMRFLRKLRKGVVKVLWFIALAICSGFGGWFFNQHWK